jgi:hypothetical protein
VQANRRAGKAGGLILMGIAVAACAPMVLVALLDVLSMRDAPSHFMTTTEMSLIECKRNIQRYAIEHNALPSHEMKDSWGHSISYSIDASGMVTLLSYGQDNKPGGTGSDADMIGRYPSRQPDGRWSDESAPWAKEPYPPEPPDAPTPKEPRAKATSR